MAQYAWHDCPAAIRAPVERLLDELRAAHQRNLAGVYLHGSLAMGCFNPERSDLDLLVVTRERMAPEERRDVAEALLRYPVAPAPIEVSFVSQTQLHPWSHPAPYDFHFGADWHARVAEDLASGAWRQWGGEERRDPDLAAHVTVARGRGVALHGPPPSALLPAVPRADYLDSILADVAWGSERLDENPVYLILNLCRIYAYVREGIVCSKDEGATWALHELPPDERPVVEVALATYRGEQPAFQGVARPALLRFVEALTARITAGAAG
jgi:predicted nucleotidyltransferase